MTLQAETAGGRRLNPLRLAAWGGAALLMLAPVVASQLTAEMDWSPGDFVFWGVMLLAGCGVFELSARMSKDLRYQFAACVAMGAAILLVVVNGAVGIIGSEEHPANLLYLAVIALGVGGVVGAGARPGGMSRALVAVAAAQVLVGVLALAGDWGAGSENQLPAIVGATAVFAALWLLSAGLFRRVAKDAASAAA